MTEQVFKAMQERYDNRQQKSEVVEKLVVYVVINAGAYRPENFIHKVFINKKEAQGYVKNAHATDQLELQEIEVE